MRAAVFFVIPRWRRWRPIYCLPSAGIVAQVSARAAQRRCEPIVAEYVFSANLTRAYNDTVDFMAAAVSAVTRPPPAGDQFVDIKSAPLSNCASDLGRSAPKRLTCAVCRRRDLYLSRARPATIRSECQRPTTTTTAAAATATTAPTTARKRDAPVRRRHFNLHTCARTCAAAMIAAATQWPLRASCLQRWRRPPPRRQGRRGAAQMANWSQCLSARRLPAAAAAAADGSPTAMSVCNSTERTTSARRNRIVAPLPCLRSPTPGDT